MAFNQYMHPRNIYRQKPNYETLAHMYPQFATHLTFDANGRATLDYSNTNSLRALTVTLLKHDFGLNVQIPDGRLVPTLPMRLNYLLWVEDLLKTVRISENETIIGLDIGTGCCAIFPLLGVKINNRWSFIATEIDSTNLEYAKLNVANNNLAERIRVCSGSPESIFIDASAQVGQVRFLMTNPPFFSDTFNEEETTNSLGSGMLHQKKVCSSCPNEAVVEGGEVSFIKQIINESLRKKNEIDLYTVMMGRRKSFLEVKYLLKDYEKQQIISSITYTELCQGNTKRWAIGWTFSNEIDLTNVPRTKCVKSKPLQYNVPSSIECCEYDIKSISNYIQKLLVDLKIRDFTVIETRKTIEFDIKSHTNTWGNQRRKRRQSKQNELISDQLSTDMEVQSNISQEFQGFKRVYLEESCEDEEASLSTAMELTKRKKIDSNQCTLDLTILLHCSLKIKRDKQQIYLKMETKEMSQNKEQTFQILQYLKNKLK